ncbi:hypothetical protein FHT40_006554 [Mycolicibacterium sp. BK556]|uniref:hypothetical protein n=1 Tax=unclassified Mycolicibacterium TaxID=2636767 RepID=UPI00160CBF13|nr:MULTISPECIES: hypothetical protein [unclassified Mycolicibacterium]MBB3606861.1 hypothetical protein [Mycolicibacterium sp. BK556]MBB3636473.1 hypothetical protein [Mycolicibacterium sp. BK607]MBB3754440.1 hypothetical protein [Mycolicibacterium sp. BK634]
MTLTVADIERWNAGDVREVFHAATSRAQAAFDAADGLATLPAFATWGGESAAAAKQAIGQTRKDLDAHGNEALAVANAARSAADNIERIKSELASLKADAESLGMEIDPVSGTVLSGPKIRDPMEAELKQAQLQPRLNTIVAEANLVDLALANAINMAGGKTPIPPGASAPPVADQRSSQIAAFREVYGSDPATSNDWTMAAALDPNSYDPKYLGAPPEIVAGRFTPQPGRGVVRSNMFIPAEQVQNTFKDGTDVLDGRLAPMNYGDNRGPSADASVEASRVSLFVDYDHGIVVARQNPTVNVDGQRGGAMADVPSIHVVQSPDGRLTIDYNANDAYEFPPAAAAGMTVNGRITLAPQADGAVSIGGNTTIYPSMETYQYRDGGSPTQLQWSPANSGSEWGPGTSLMRHHWVGDSNISAVRPDMPRWLWEAENAIPFADDPFVSHTTQLTDPANGPLPTVGTGR